MSKVRPVPNAQHNFGPQKDFQQLSRTNDFNETEPAQRKLSVQNAAWSFCYFCPHLSFWIKYALWHAVTH